MFGAETYWGETKNGRRESAGAMLRQPFLAPTLSLPLFVFLL
jgi:hypothetical protein